MRPYIYRSRRNGVAMFYVIVCLIAMLGFCSLAVDFGRVQTAKTELRRVADAAARAGVASLASGASTSTMQTAATAISTAGYNTVDGSSYTISTSLVTKGHWTAAGGFTTSGSTGDLAVQVGELTYNVPLLFGKILGKSTCQVTATSIAALVPIQSTTQSISAQSNIWLSGEPKGTLGSEPDPGYSSAAHPYKYDIAGDPSIAYGQPGGPGSSVSASPPTSSEDPTFDFSAGKVESTDYNNQQLYNSIMQFNITVTPGSIIQISNESGETNNQGEFTSGSGSTTANGDDGGSYTEISDDASNPSLAQGTTSTSGSEHGISNIITPLNSMVGVFLDNNPADDSSDSNYSTTPSGLDFSTQSKRDYTTLSPELAQSFYAGTGETSSGTQQTVVVPNHATRLFLGSMDGHEWSNNVGSFTATITQYAIEMVK